MDHSFQFTDPLEILFNPKSIAIIGVPREMKSGKIFLMGLLDQGFKGRIYPVHPVAQEIDGLKAYPSVTAIPEPVDLAIVLVPHHITLPIIQECAAKGVKGAVLFTAGYRETGTSEGKALEEELVRIARTAGMRIIGPNCMGIYSPSSGLSFFPELPKRVGHVGIISHSGSLANILGHVASLKGISFSKVVSLGNESDLHAADFLAYMGRDTETHVIGCYLENIKNGPSFLEALREASLKKPVILWKVGLTSEGSRAAASHTGALTGTRHVWEGVVRQTGTISVTGFEEWIDTLAGTSLLSTPLGEKLAIVSGPGGLAVSAAEACGNQGLRLAELAEETRSDLGKVLPHWGTSFNNPVDVGFTAVLDLEIFNRVVRIVAVDQNVDSLIVIGRGFSPESNLAFQKGIIQARKESQKPFLMIDIPGFGGGLSRGFQDAGIPFFDTAERGIATYARLRKYQVWRNRKIGER